jgi:CHAT domain-containing protein/tetratricopeptide (TPR) repeat protein
MLGAILGRGTSSGAMLIGFALVAGGSPAWGGDPPVRADEVQPDTERLEPRNALAWEALRLRGAGRLAEAMDAADRMIEVERKLFGDEHEDLAGALEFAAGFHAANEDLAGALARLREAFSIRERVGGADHWQTADARLAIERFGRLSELSGDRLRKYREGLRLLDEINQAGRHSYDVPEQIERKTKAIDALTEALGQEHPESAQYLDQLGWLYRDLASNDRGETYRKQAEELFRQALELRRTGLGEHHPDVAASLEQIASVTGGEDDREARLALYRRALEVRLRGQGERHPAVARTLSSLAQEVARKGGRPDEAMELAERAVAIVEATLGPDDLSMLSPLQLRVRLATELGDRALRERVHDQLLSWYRRRFETDAAPGSGQWIWRLGTPPDAGTLRSARRWSEFATRESYATALMQRSSFHGEAGEIGRAGQWIREAMDAFAENFERQAAVAQEQVHFDPMTSGMYVLALDRFLMLSLDPVAEITPDEAYRQVLSWKGGYFAHELRARRWRSHPEIAPLAAELRAASARLASSALSAPRPEDRAAWGRIVEELARRDRLEGRIADRAAALRERQDRERPDVERLKAALPEGTALVDFKVFTAWSGWGAISPERRRLMAFVVRSNGPVVRLDLGAWGPLESAIARWRQYALPPRDPAAAGSARSRAAGLDAAARLLTEQLWDPLRPHLDGVDTILTSPDRDLCKLPLGALAGSAPGTFLLEERAIATVPVPQLLLEARRSGEPANGPEKLVAVGDVDFGAEPGGSLDAKERAERGPRLATMVPRARLMQFDPLAGTKRELDTVQALFAGAFPGGEAVTLREAGATEAAFRQALSKARYVHLATHGFFEPPELAPVPVAAGDDLSYWRTPQGLVRLSPGLLSGVAFAGANRTVSPDQDDGILTAVEAQQLDLDGVELVVLSACETALGSAVSGEGLMGLQRAFQVAGSRTLVSTLWSVDDAATAMLVEEFYANLWKRSLPRLEALRRAQLAVMLRYDPATQAPRPEGADPRRIAPFYWGAFTLSGEWR